MSALKAMGGPDVSVVVGVHNGRPALRETLENILSQAGVDLELVLVDDGSTDGSESVLTAYAAREQRIRIVRQEQAGLTSALIRGCALARGEYIARQDVGDISLPGRLRTQLDWLAARPGTVLASCGMRMVGPRGEVLYEVLRDDGDVSRTLHTRGPVELDGPPHRRGVRVPAAPPGASSVFRRAAYEKVGGYRAQFYFAQDLDLWVRLTEVGDYTVVPEILYRAAVGPDSISGHYRREQVALTQLIAESARLRRAGLGDEAVLQRAAAIRPASVSRERRAARSRALYFIGACLRKRCDPAAVEYFKRAIRENPLLLRAWWRLLSSR